MVTADTSCALERTEGRYVDIVVLRGVRDIAPDDRTPQVSMAYNPTVLKEVPRAVAS
ncbi:hypothetical protein [Streptomyces sp. WG5]|uniref:hypothetical protein n=1 Tax=Streptomyces sp. WG5 TaxID=3417648 RepID=UPI003CF8C9A9